MSTTSQVGIWLAIAPSHKVWMKIAQEFNFQTLQTMSNHTSVSEWWNELSQQPHPDSAQLLQVITYTAWNIWKERCRRVFDNRAMSIDQLVSIIKIDIANYRAAHVTRGIA